MAPPSRTVERGAPPIFRDPFRSTSQSPKHSLDGSLPSGQNRIWRGTLLLDGPPVAAEKRRQSPRKKRFLGSNKDSARSHSLFSMVCSQQWDPPTFKRNPVDRECLMDGTRTKTSSRTHANRITRSGVQWMARSPIRLSALGSDQCR